MGWAFSFQRDLPLPKRRLKYDSVVPMENHVSVAHLRLDELMLCKCVMGRTVC